VLKRWISGLLLGGVTLACLIAGGVWWMGLIIIGLLLASLEWANLGNCSFWSVAAVVIAGFGFIVYGMLNFLPLLLFIPLSIILWSNTPGAVQEFTLAASGLLWLSFPFYFLLLLRRGVEISGEFIPGIWLVGILILTTVLQNTLALYAGLFFGTRLTFFEGLSPNKSTVGFLGGLAGVVLVFGSAFYAGLFPFGLSLLLAAGLAVAGPSGDLLISAFKRNNNLDDTGSIIPGHGGILDRIDSLLANTIIFYLLVNISGYLS